MYTYQNKMGLQISGFQISGLFSVPTILFWNNFFMLFCPVQISVEDSLFLTQTNCHLLLNVKSLLNLAVKKKILRLIQ